MPETPEQQARQTIDAVLAAAGWAVQDYNAFDSYSLFGMALREVSLRFCRRAGVIEAMDNPEPIRILLDIPHGNPIC